ncbi:hypothetical protein BDZ97DRAFT_2079535 [Flammula alnicola]|nr:hypothetical protein BDZ97DRAFT_2079535 [Flammula alnicola]
MLSSSQPPLRKPPPGTIRMHLPHFRRWPPVFSVRTSHVAPAATPSHPAGDVRADYRQKPFRAILPEPFCRSVEELLSRPRVSSLYLSGIEDLPTQAYSRPGVPYSAQRQPNILTLHIKLDLFFLAPNTSWTGSSQTHCKIAIIESLNIIHPAVEDRRNPLQPRALSPSRKRDDRNPTPG